MARTKRSPVSLTGKVVAVTGGARGIGRATAEAFLDQGAKVAVGDVDVELAEKTAAELGAKPGAEIVGLPLDVTDRGSFATFLDEAEKQLGSLDVVVNNAGIMPTGSFLDETDKVTDSEVDINLRGVLIGSKLAGRKFRDRGQGQIVNIASVAGLVAAPGVATYCATKYAVVGLGQALFQELAPHGVTVTTICPAYVNTQLIAGVTQPWLVRKIGLVEPEDVSAAIVDSVEHERGGQRLVPRTGGAVVNSMRLVPERGRNAVAKLLGVQHVALETDETARAAYRERTEHLDLDSTKKRGAR